MQVDPIKFTLKASVTKRLKLKHVKLLSSFAFKFNLRRYNQESGRPNNKLAAIAAGGGVAIAGLFGKAAAGRAFPTSSE